MTIAGLNVDTDIGHEIIDQVHKPQNALMHQKMQKNLIEGIVPILVRIVDEGIRKEIFHVKYPAQTIEMLIIFANIVFDDSYDEEGKKSGDKTEAFLYNTELLLGAKEGSLRNALIRVFDRRRGSAE